MSYAMTMPADGLEAFRTQAHAGQVVLHYSGEITSPVVAMLSDTVRKRLDDSAPDRRIARRVFSAFVEMAQNILHYASSDDGGQPHGTLTVTHGEQGFSVLCCNRVRNDQIRRLRERVEAVRTMTADEIKTAYRTQLRNDAPDPDGVSKGAGLGFLTLARESSAPINYRIAPVAGCPDDAEFHLFAVI